MPGESGCGNITVRFFTKKREFTENNSQEFRPSVVIAIAGDHLADDTAFRITRRVPPHPQPIPRTSTICRLGGFLAEKERHVWPSWTPTSKLLTISRHFLDVPFMINILILNDNWQKRGAGAWTSLCQKCRIRPPHWLRASHPFGHVHPNWTVWWFEAKHPHYHYSSPFTWRTCTRRVHGLQVGLGCTTPP
ncbi:predicted protein [Histoplasma capsulatum var. duboisii H88]|uniref:Predicted protein n=2 Tax=Ajellomyces capsulatus TaxID=5037 RepID=F0UUZ9_AJEC8|nr:predicted protein [Histoplasma capsulatum H143]EGC49726.1 predicted protein [Histoplasma capsulatum var. duboisii H88]